MDGRVADRVAELIIYEVSQEQKNLYCNYCIKIARHNFQTNSGPSVQTSSFLATPYQTQA